MHENILLPACVLWNALILWIKKKKTQKTIIQCMYSYDCINKWMVWIMIAECWIVARWCVFWKWWCPGPHVLPGISIEMNCIVLHCWIVNETKLYFYPFRKQRRKVQWNKGFIRTNFPSNQRWVLSEWGFLWIIKKMPTNISKKKI